MNLTRRPRRNRKSEVIRNMVQENAVTVNDLIFPIFVLEGQNQAIPINFHAGHFPVQHRPDAGRNCRHA